jgi:hypothetical protein
MYNGTHARIIVENAFLAFDGSPTCHETPRVPIAGKMKAFLGNEMVIRDNMKKVTNFLVDCSCLR